MKTIKNLLNKLLNLICKIAGYDRSADLAKTKEAAAKAEAEMVAIEEETDRILKEATVRLEEIAAENQLRENCHQVMMRILDLTKQYGYSLEEANRANESHDLQTLYQIEEDMLSGNYMHEMEMREPKKQKKAKVVHMRRPSRNAAYA